jgi:hypothetical protein
LAKIKQIQT